MVIGLGVSAIGDSWTSFAQNVKLVEAYYDKLDHDELPILKGHHLSQQDEVIRKKILDLIYRYRADWTDEEYSSFGAAINLELLDELQHDGLVVMTENGIEVQDKGKPFIRNICMAFDVHLWSKKDVEVKFSRTI